MSVRRGTPVEVGDAVLPSLAALSLNAPRRPDPVPVDAWCQSWPQATNKGITAATFYRENPPASRGWDDLTLKLTDVAVKRITDEIAKIEKRFPTNRNNARLPADEATLKFPGWLRQSARDKGMAWKTLKVYVSAIKLSLPRLKIDELPYRRRGFNDIKSYDWSSAPAYSAGSAQRARLCDSMIRYAKGGQEDWRAIMWLSEVFPEKTPTNTWEQVASSLAGVSAGATSSYRTALPSAAAPGAAPRLSEEAGGAAAAASSEEDAEGDVADDDYDGGAAAAAALALLPPMLSASRQPVPPPLPTTDSEEEEHQRDANQQREHFKVVRPLIKHLKSEGYTEENGWRIFEERSIFNDGSGLRPDVFIYGNGMTIVVECKMTGENNFSHAIGQVMRYNALVTHQNGRLRFDTPGWRPGYDNAMMIIATDIQPPATSIADAEGIGDIACWWPGASFKQTVVQGIAKYKAKYGQSGSVVAPASASASSSLSLASLSDLSSVIAAYGNLGTVDSDNEWRLLQRTSAGEVFMYHPWVRADEHRRWLQETIDLSRVASEVGDAARELEQLNDALEEKYLELEYLEKKEIKYSVSGKRGRFPHRAELRQLADELAQLRSGRLAPWEADKQEISLTPDAERGAGNFKWDRANTGTSTAYAIQAHRERTAFLTSAGAANAPPVLAAASPENTKVVQPLLAELETDPKTYSSSEWAQRVDQQVYVDGNLRPDVFLHNADTCVLIECKMWSENNYSHALGQLLRYAYKAQLPGNLLQVGGTATATCRDLGLVIALDQAPSEAAFDITYDVTESSFLQHSRHIGVWWAAGDTRADWSRQAGRPLIHKVIARTLGLRSQSQRPSRSPSPSRSRSPSPSMYGPSDGMVGPPNPRADEVMDAKRQLEEAKGEQTRLTQEYERTPVALRSDLWPDVQRATRKVAELQRLLQELGA